MKTQAAIAKLISHAVCIVLVANLSPLAVHTLTAAEPLSAAAEVDFKGTSTLHDFHGRVAAQPFTILLPLVTRGEPRTWSAEAELRVGDMTTAHKDRDRNMFRMFGAGQYPTIHAVVENAAVPSDVPAKGEGKFRIRNIERTIPFTITDWKEDADGVTFHATFELSLKAFGLKPPSVIGIIRVGDRVIVESDVKASRRAVKTSQQVNQP